MRLKAFILFVLLVPAFLDAGELKFSIPTQAFDLTCADCIGATEIDETAAYAFSSTSNSFIGATFRGPTADSADSGIVRLANAESICWEASPTGTDYCFTVNSSEQLDSDGDVMFTQTDTPASATDYLTPYGFQYTINPGVDMDTYYGADVATIEAITAGSNKVGALTGVKVIVRQTSTDELVNPSGINVVMRNQGNAAMSDPFAISISTPVNSGGGTMTGNVGLKILNQNVGTGARSIEVGGFAPVEFDPPLYLTNIQNGNAVAKDLTAASATPFLQIDVAADSFEAGLLHYVIRANDASDIQARSGVIPFVAVNDAGTEVCTVGTVGAATEVVAVSTGTLTNTFTCTTTPTNGVLLNANAASSLTETTLNITFWVEITSGAATLTLQ